MCIKKAQFETTNELKLCAFTPHATTRQSAMVSDPDNQNIFACVLFGCVCMSAEKQKPNACPEARRESQVLKGLWGKGREHYNFLSAAGPSQWKEGGERWERKMEIGESLIIPNERFHEGSESVQCSQLLVFFCDNVQMDWHKRKQVCCSKAFPYQDHTCGIYVHVADLWTAAVLFWNVLKYVTLCE